MAVNIQIKKGLTLSLSLLFFGACSSESSDDTDNTAEPTVATPQYSGILQTAQGAYRFTPKNCFVHNENGVDDIEIEGPGTAPDGETIYFELTSTGNSVRISLGVGGRFQSSDRMLTGGQHVTEPFSLDVAGGNLTIAKLVMVDGNGQKVDDHASLKIDCSN